MSGVLKSETPSFDAGPCPSKRGVARGRTVDGREDLANRRTRPPPRAGRRVALCVPCVKSHTLLLGELLRSLERQSLKGFRVFVAGDLEELPLGAPRETVFIRTDDGSPPGVNRNAAAQAATLDGCDILSFMDADDLMHPDRLKVVLEALGPCKRGILLHALTRDEAGLDELAAPQIKEFSCESAWIMKCHRSTKHRMDLNCGLVIHYGHVSVSSVAWSESPFGKARLGEDAMFVRDVLDQEDVSLIYCGHPLSVYRQEHSTSTMR